MRSEFSALPPFKRCEASLHGLADRDFRRLVTNGVLVRLAHGLVAGRDWIDSSRNDAMAEATRVMAMLRRYPGARAAGRSAAALNGLWLIDRVGPVHLFRDAGWPRLRYDVRVETVAVDPSDICDVLGVPSTGLIRSALDAAREADPREAVAIMDSALRLGAQRSELLARAINPWVHAAVAFADSRSESALESVSRWEIHRARLPAPEIQVWFYDGAVPYARTDFYWRALRLVGEADGALKYDDDGLAKAAEVDRQCWLEDRGETVIRWGWDEAINASNEFTSWLRDEMNAAADRQGLPLAI